jgi:hypothetical protein
MGKTKGTKSNKRAATNGGRVDKDKRPKPTPAVEEDMDVGLLLGTSLGNYTMSHSLSIHESIL